MRQRLTIIVALILIICLCSCVPGTQFTIRRVPEIDLLDKKFIGVEPFVISGSLDMIKDLESSFFEYMFEVMTETDERGDIARSNRELSSIHQTGLSSVIMHDGFFTVNRSRDWEVSVGGTMVYKIQDDVETQERTDPHDGKKFPVAVITRAIDLDVTLIVSDRRGDIIGSSRFALEKSVQVEDRYLKKAIEDLGDWQIPLKEIIEETYIPILQRIAPYNAQEKRTFARGKSRLIKEANKAARKGHWAEAVSLWNQAAESNDVRDKAAVLYNLAIQAEVEDDFEQALILYEQAYELERTKQFLAAITRTRLLLDEKNRLLTSGK